MHAKSNKDKQLTRWQFLLVVVANVLSFPFYFFLFEGIVRVMFRLFSVRVADSSRELYALVVSLPIALAVILLWRSTRKIGPIAQAVLLIPALLYFLTAEVSNVYFTKPYVPSLAELKHIIILLPIFVGVAGLAGAVVVILLRSHQSKSEIHRS